MARYKGRHRAPSTTGKTIAKVATTSVIAVMPLGFVATPASADTNSDLEAIAQCESANRNVNNNTSSASGYWQIIDGTWAGNGGKEFAPRAIHATREQQKLIAVRIAAKRGSYADWNPSKSCWGNRVGRPAVSASIKVSGPKHAAPTGRAPDGSGTYTCDAAHLYFNDCDEDNIGEIVNYPLYKGKKVHAVSGKHRGTYTCDAAHLLYDACDPGNLGETVHYPARRA
jgi:hypothetical protein